MHYLTLRPELLMDLRLRRLQDDAFAFLVKLVCAVADGTPARHLPPLREICLATDTRVDKARRLLETLRVEGLVEPAPQSDGEPGDNAEETAGEWGDNPEETPRKLWVISEFLGKKSEVKPAFQRMREYRKRMAGQGLRESPRYGRYAERYEGVTPLSRAVCLSSLNSSPEDKEQEQENTIPRAHAGGRNAEAPEPTPAAAVAPPEAPPCPAPAAVPLNTPEQVASAEAEVDRLLGADSGAPQCVRDLCREYRAAWVVEAAKVMAKRSPASAVPHTGMGLPRCSTMPLSKRRAGATLACRPRTVMRQSKMMPICFM